VTVHNRGPARATFVTMSDDLPPSVTLGSADARCVWDGGTGLHCDIGDLARGASRSVNIRVYPNSAGSITNSASAAGAERDPDTSNNRDSVDTAVVLPLRTLDQVEVDLAYQSSLDMESSAGSVRGQMVINKSAIRETDNQGTRIYHVGARTGTNQFEASLAPGTRAEGTWRFDFSGSSRYVNGSLRVISGRVLSLTGHSVIFAVGESSPIHFSLELQ
jgi:hypothetical protein